MSATAHAPPTPLQLLDALDTLRAVAPHDLSVTAQEAFALVDRELTRMHQQRNELRQFLACAQAAGSTHVTIATVWEALTG